MSTRAPAVEARQLIKTYPGDVTALNGMDLSVGAGTVFGLLGPNGAGKSTTVKILTTLARPDSGAATVAGHDVLRHPDRVRRAIGVVAQKSGADPVATGRENLLLQGRLYGMRGAAIQRRADELLDRFDLAGAAKRQVKGYSGGMQRRLDVALGLVHRPEVLFLDEPTTGLDPEARTAMWDEISRLAGDEGLTIVLTTHYLEEADRLAERIAIVDRGRIVVEPDRIRVAQALLDELQEEPAADERQAGFSTDVPANLQISGARGDDPAAVLRLSEQPEDLLSEALAQIVCTYAESESLASDGTVLLGGPGNYAPRAYLCTSETKARPEAVPTLGAAKLS